MLNEENLSVIEVKTAEGETAETCLENYFGMGCTPSTEVPDDIDVEAVVIVKPV